MSDAAAPPFDLRFDTPAGQCARLSPLVRRIVAPNPGPMTFTGTCTYLVGRGAVAVIDPGPALPQHIDALLSGVAGERVAAIFVTHTHRDHSPGAALLQARTGAPVIGCAPYAPARAPHDDTERRNMAASNDGDFRPDRELRDGERWAGEDFSLEAVATPGHTMNHLAFALPEERALFSGDHVMAWSTTVVAPPTGAMGPFMLSLDKLRLRDDAVFWPGHGGPVRDPQRFVRGLLHHRRQREHAIMARLKAGDATVDAIVTAIYDGLDRSLVRAAGLSVLAHLEDLCAKGSATCTEEAAGLRFAPAG